MDECLRRVLAARSPALFLDFDGTLVRLRPRPGDAALPRARRELLARLAAKIPLAFVSGRSLENLAGRIAVAGAGYIGNHGLEIRCRGGEWVHPGARRAAPELRGLLGQLRKMTRRLAGVQVEDKGLSGSVHYRRAPGSKRRLLRRLVRGEMAGHSRTLRLVPGKMVMDILPRLPWDKGRAVVRYAGCLGSRGPVTKIYIGDDRTDEDAFRALARRDIGIAVGRRRVTAAEFRRRDVDAVWRLLAALDSRFRDFSRRPS